MVEQSGGAHHVRILHRVAADAELDLVIAFDRPQSGDAGVGEGVWWEPQTRLGLFLQRRADPGIVYKIAVVGGPANGDCLACSNGLRQRTSSSPAPRRKVPGPNQKFVYDIHAKALVKRLSFNPFAMNRLFVAGEKVVLVGSDYRRIVAIEYQPGQDPPFRVMKGAEAETWTSRVPTTSGTAGAGADQHVEIYLPPKEFKPVHFGPDNRFTLSGTADHLVVLERTGGTMKKFPLPQSTDAEFSAARPGRRAAGESRHQIAEEIGPWQVVDGTLWFAKTFYDGEGMSGVGGFGYFDSTERKYQIYSPQEVRTFAASAMLVEPDAVWLGLVHNGEWGSTGGGVLRFDRTTRQANRIALREVVGEIARVGNRLVMATTFGAALLDGDKLRRFFVDETSDGRLRVAEGIAGDK